MKYLCMVYFDDALLQAMPPSERARLDADSMAYDKELAARGQLVVAEALQSVKTAKVVQVRSGRMSQTDGPFAETKEQLGGFILVDVQDLNAAIQVAARIPLAQVRQHRGAPDRQGRKDRIMRYLCMIFATDEQMSVLAPAEMAAFVNEHLDYDDQLRASGHLVESEGLEAARTAAVVRVRNGRLSVTDGPFVETNEQLGGFYLVEAAGEEEAVRIAAGIPSSRVGSIEVRPVGGLGERVMTAADAAPRPARANGSAWPSSRCPACSIRWTSRCSTSRCRT